MGKARSHRRLQPVTAGGRRRPGRHAWPLALLASVVFAMVGYLAWTYGWAGVPAVGEAAPAFVLEDSEGQPVDLGAYLGTKPVVLAFYMTYG